MRVMGVESESKVLFLFLHVIMRREQEGERKTSGLEREEREA